MKLKELETVKYLCCQKERVFVVVLRSELIMVCTNCLMFEHPSSVYGGKPH